MSIALATRGVLGGFIAAGAGAGEPYPLPIEDMEVLTYDVKDPLIDVNPGTTPTEPIDFDRLEEYLPTKTSTIQTLPSAGLRTFPLPKNL